MGKIHNTSYQKGCSDGKHAHGKILHIVIHQGHDFKPQSPHTFPSAKTENRDTSNAQGSEGLDPSCTAEPDERRTQPPP